MRRTEEMASPKARLVEDQEVWGDDSASASGSGTTTSETVRG